MIIFPELGTNLGDLTDEIVGDFRISGVQLNITLCIDNKKTNSWE